MTTLQIRTIRQSPMKTACGTVTLMGSGELTATMVEVHKQLLAGFAHTPKAVFLDTPAGFQLNVDRISEKAADYFQQRIHHPLTIASLRSATTTSPVDREAAFQTLTEADYILIGPGSPTYAVKELGQTPVPDILSRRVIEGGCLVAASAAALTVGRFTLPVYEIYKVGRKLHWVEGMNILADLGFNLVVIPHWNNAEGGTHDTRRCFMGESRYLTLEAMLPEDVTVLGLDEHTACIIDFKSGQAAVRGIGRMVLRHKGKEAVFTKGDTLSIAMLKNGALNWHTATKQPGVAKKKKTEEPDDEPSFWDAVHRIEAEFHAGMNENDSGRAVSAVLSLDRAIWQARQALKNDDIISEARETLRDLIVLMGTQGREKSMKEKPGVETVIDEFLALRERFRKKKEFQSADEIRNCLNRLGVEIQDHPGGVKWTLTS